MTISLFSSPQRVFDIHLVGLVANSLKRLLDTTCLYNLITNIFIFIFQKKTPFISYKVLQMSYG